MDEKQLAKLHSKVGQRDLGWGGAAEGGPAQGRDRVPAGMDKGHPPLSVHCPGDPKAGEGCVPWHRGLAPGLATTAARGARVRPECPLKCITCSANLKYLIV